MIQPDGKLVAAGGCGHGLHGVSCLARYNPDGRLDDTFGRSGTVTTVWTSGANALVVQPDGKLVAAGGGRSPSGAGFILARYLG